MLVGLACSKRENIHIVHGSEARPRLSLQQWRSQLPADPHVVPPHVRVACVKKASATSRWLTYQGFAVLHLEGEPFNVESLILAQFTPGMSSTVRNQRGVTCSLSKVCKQTKLSMPKRRPARGERFWNRVKAIFTHMQLSLETVSL
jgi:hypothetical protein